MKLVYKDDNEDDDDDDEGDDEYDGDNYYKRSLNDFRL